LRKYSWAVVAPLFCDKDDVLPILRQQFVDVSTARPGTEGDSPEGQCVSWFRGVLASATRAALERNDIHALRPPVPEDESVIVYCPRCHAQFGRAARASCTSCVDISLVAFASSEAKTRS
jgi:hypothetical protein